MYHLLHQSIQTNVNSVWLQMAHPASALMLPYSKAADDQDANRLRQLEKKNSNLLSSFSYVNKTQVTKTEYGLFSL